MNWHKEYEGTLTWIISCFGGKATGVNSNVWFPIFNLNRIDLENQTAKSFLSLRKIHWFSYKPKTNDHTRPFEFFETSNWTVLLSIINRLVIFHQLKINCFMRIIQGKYANINECRGFCEGIKKSKKKYTEAKMSLYLIQVLKDGIFPCTHHW